MSNEDQSVDRRSFLKVAGAGSVMGASSMLAGCTGGQGTTQGGGGSATPTSTPKASEITRGGTLKVALQSDPWTLHPHMYQDTSSAQLAQNYGNKLLDTTNQGELIPDLAKEVPKPQDGGKKYTFKLREGVKFHGDWGEVTADDVVANYRKILDADYGSPARSDYAGILVGDGIDPKDTVKKTGKYEVTFNLAKVYAPFLYKLTDSRMTVIPMDALKKHGKKKYGTVDVGTWGTGPFKFKEGKPDDHYTLVKNDEYFKQARDGKPLPYVDKIVFNIVPEASTRKTQLKTGGIHISEMVPARDVKDLKGTKKVKILSRPGASLESHYINQRTFGPFKKKKVRKALGYASNKKAIKSVKFKGLAARAWSIFPPWHWAYDGDAVTKYKHDPKKAKKLLKQAGEKGLKFKCTPTNQPLFTDVASILQQNYSKVGLDMQITPKEKSAAWGPTIGGWDKKTFKPKDKVGPAASFESLVEDITYGFGADGYSYISFHTGSWLNVSYYSNDKVDTWLEKARTTTKRSKRKELYSKAQKKIMEDIPQIPLVWWNVNQGVRKKVKGFDIYPSFELDLAQTWIEQ